MSTALERSGSSQALCIAGPVSPTELRRLPRLTTSSVQARNPDYSSTSIKGDRCCAITDSMAVHVGTFVGTLANGISFKCSEPRTKATLKFSDPVVKGCRQGV